MAGKDFNLHVRGTASSCLLQDFEFRKSPTKTRGGSAVAMIRCLFSVYDHQGHLPSKLKHLQELMRTTTQHLGSANRHYVYFPDVPALENTHSSGTGMDSSSSKLITFIDRASWPVLKPENHG